MNALLYGGLAIIGWSLYSYSKSKSPLAEEEGEEVEEVQSAAITLRAPAGHRRAKQSEVTPAIAAQAQASLSNEIGTMLGPFQNENGVSYYVGLETHSNAPKGASVFIQA